MIEWSSKALADVAAVFDHIAQDDFPTAEDVVRRIFAAALRLEQFPNIGRPGRKSGTRELVLPHLSRSLVYTHTESTIHVVRVLHDAQSCSEL